METQDLLKLPASSNSGQGSETDDVCESGSEAIKSDSLPLNSEIVDKINGETPATISGVLNENMDTLMEDDFARDADNSTPILPVAFEMKDSAATETNTFSGVKRARIDVDEQQPSVHVIYSSLPRKSKQKLEELLYQWSRWHSQKCSPSDDSNEILESGEETFFPALRVGLDKPSEVTFWVDNQTKLQSSREFVPLDGTSVPLYDRGYSLALTSADGSSSSLDGRVEKLDTSRCFNCGSYSHALKDCTKPRDSVAVNNARKEHNSKRIQRANSRNSTRYYQSSRGGKYDGLTPGVLDAETRQVLGIGEHDPPPWLNRMREIGYPPGYLDQDMEDQPSGITIVGDEDSKDEFGEEGEILDGTHSEPSRKMTVEFPGINAPIPENGDERLWAPGSSFPSLSRHHHRSNRRHNNSSENLSSGHYTERKWSRDLEDDGPPGCDPGTSPSLSNHFRRYGDYDSGHYSQSPQTSPSVPWSPSYGRSWSDRGRRSPIVQDGPSNYGQYGSYPPYTSPR